MKQAVSLSRLQEIVRDAVYMSPAGRGLWVTAELVDVRVSGGHCYMELVEKDAAGVTVAKMRANIWRNLVGPLNAKFSAATGSQIRSGLKVMVGGCANHHPVYGLSFNIQDIDPSYTLGDMERLRREILQRLTAEGVAGYNKSLPLTSVPQKIAVISAQNAAGYGDFIDQLMCNPEGLKFYPKLFPAVLQGERTSASVRAALAQIEMSIDLWDCVCIIRGGGATSDLNGFDDYDLARAVATFPIPVVVGIGHERDRTVLDEIAHTRIKTPTGVAAFFLDRARSGLAAACNCVSDIIRFATDYLNGERRRLEQAASLIPTLTSAHLLRARQNLSQTATLIPALARGHLENGRQRLSSAAAVIPTLVRSRIATETRLLDDIEQKIVREGDNIMHRACQRLDAISGLIDAYSPEKTLRRGYSITRINGRALTDAEAVNAGDEIVTTLSQGEIRSTIIPKD